MVHIYILT